MKILIKSRKQIEALARNPFSEKTMLISITDANESQVHLEYEPEFLIRLSFDDVDNDVINDALGKKPSFEERFEIECAYNFISLKQADDIANMFLRHMGEIDVLICQCEHGQSRSAAVAAAILEFRSKRGVEVFANDKYYPNKVVYRRTLKSLQQNSLDVISNC